jgi:hypothetical protein
VFAHNQKVVERGREANTFGNGGEAEGLDSREGSDTSQHIDERSREIEVAQRQENIFVRKKGLHEDGV